LQFDVLMFCFDARVFRPNRCL